MSSLLAEPPAVLPPGCEVPRICTHPPFEHTSGDDLADFAARYGLVLDPWQRQVLRIAMGEKPDGRWAAGEVGIVVPRQNGKGSIIEARELGGLFLLDEQLITHTAHEFKTASDAYRRIRGIVEGSPELMRRVARMPNSPVEKAIELKNGNKLSFIARSGGSGRGFSGDVIILDEAYDLSQDHMDALVPTLTTALDPQIWYTSSAGKAHSVVLAGIRERGIAGAPRLAYMEWSVEEPDLDAPLLDPSDPDLLAQANPALGIRVSADYLEIERGALSLAGLLRERLGIFDPIDTTSTVFPDGRWEAIADPSSAITGPVTFAIEVAEDRSWSCIAAAGPSPAAVHVESVDYRRGTGWVVDRAQELTETHGWATFVVQPSSPAGSLIGDLENANLRVVKASVQDYAQACGDFYDAVIGAELRHLSQPEVNVSVRGAKKKPSGDAYVWDRRKSGLDISPLAAETLAFWGHVQHGQDPWEGVW